MTTGWLLVAATLTVPSQAGVEGVTAYFGMRGTAVTAGAMQVATETLRKAGVRITWRDIGQHGPAPPAAWLRIDLVDELDDGTRPGALAVSYPRARCAKPITVYLDRVRALAPGANRESALLGYVLAHEIAHVIQGLNRHAEAGVMKARWSEADRAAIFARRLRFQDADRHLMHRALAAGWCVGALGVRDRSGSGTASRPD